MEISYKATGFGPSIESGILDVTWAELVWAAFTYGKSSSCYHLKYPKHYKAEKKYRIYLLYTCLKQKDINLTKSQIYMDMDQTEKGSVSYFLGMTLTKLFADRILDTPLLWHVSTSSELIACSPGKSRPDLIGCSSKLNEWIVAEAKGRSDKFDASALSKAKAQSQMINYINGRHPKFRFGSESYFSPHLCLELQDPPADEDAVSVDFKIDQALNEYYSIIQELNNVGKKEIIHGIKYITMHDEDVGVTIGLPANFTPKKLNSALHDFELKISIENQLNELEYIGKDGYFIRLDSCWSDSYMNLEPQVRGR